MRGFESVVDVYDILYVGFEREVYFLFECLEGWSY